jgi:hypothetical protein
LRKLLITLRKLLMDEAKLNAHIVLVHVELPAKRQLLELSMTFRHTKLPASDDS